MKIVGSPFAIKGLVTACVALVLDQWSKWFFIEIMHLPDQEQEISSFFKLVMVWNQGISFGMFSDGSSLNKWALVLVALAMMVVLLVWLWKSDKIIVSLALGLVLGGALGNVLDRLRFGAVADFFYFHYESYYWPAFNIADSAIFIGVVLLCWDSIVLSDRSPHA